MAFIALFLAITCTICYGMLHIIRWHWRRRRLYELAAKLQGPTALPVIGNAHMFFGKTEYYLSKLYEMNQLYSSPCRLWIGPLLCLSVFEPEHVKEILLSPKTLAKTNGLDFIRPYLGEGLLVASVAKWRVHRKLIQPTFNTKILDSFVEIFAAQSIISTQQMSRSLDRPEFEIFKLISACSLDMICESAMGVRIGAQTNRECRYVDALAKVISNTNERFFQPWLHPDFIFYHTNLGREQLENIKYLHGFADNVVQQRREEFLKRRSRTALDESMPRRDAFLDRLMEATYNNCKLSDKELRDEVDTLMVAGTDTNAITVSFVLLMLASHPDIQEIILNDWRNAVSRTDKFMTRKDCVCEIHFEPDDIEREYVHRMPDGSICRIPKEKPTLKIGALPSIFHDRDETLSSKETSNVSKKQKLNFVSTTCGNVDVIDDVDVMYSEIFEDHVPSQPPLLINVSNEFKSLADACPRAEWPTVLDSRECSLETEICDVVEDSNLVQDTNFDQIVLLSPFWTSSIVNENGIFSCWAEDLHSVAKRVIVRQDLTLEDKVYQEVFQIFGNTDVEERPVIREDLTQMEYLDRVIKETMRLFPPAPVIVREVSAELNIGDKTLPSGSIVSIGILNLHRNERYWPDPLKFDPDRFLPEKNAKRTPYTYIPFGGGPRNCIGVNYAMMAMKTLIATILRKYILKKDHIAAVQSIRLTIEVVLKPVDPIKIRIERRT